VLLEQFLKDEATDGVQRQLADGVLGALVNKNKKLWKDLKRYATSGEQRQQRQDHHRGDADAGPGHSPGIGAEP
jgi:hypothetical protein